MGGEVWVPNVSIYLPVLCTSHHNLSLDNYAEIASLKNRTKITQKTFFFNVLFLLYYIY